MKYFWAQVNAYGIAHCRFFLVKDNETLEYIVSKYFTDYEIVDIEEVTEEYALKHANRNILD